MNVTSGPYSKHLSTDNILHIWAETTVQKRVHVKQWNC